MPAVQPNPHNQRNAPIEVVHPVSSPAEIAAAMGCPNPSLTGQAFTMAQLRFGLAVAEFENGTGSFERVEKLAEALNKIVDRMAKIARRAMAKADSLYLVKLNRIGGAELRLVGLGAQQPERKAVPSPTAEVLPIVSIGPSGLGGYAQREVMDESGASAGVGVAEIDSAIAPVGNTCPECDRSISDGSACVRCSMHKGVEDHEFEGGGAFTVDEVRTLAGVCYRVLDCDGQIVPGSQTGSADGARQHAAKLNAGVGHE